MFKFEFMVLMSVNYPSYFKKSFVSNKFTKHPMHLSPISLHHNRIYFAECNKMESLSQNIWKRHAKIYMYMYMYIWRKRGEKTFLHTKRDHRNICEVILGMDVIRIQFINVNIDFQ